MESAKILIQIVIITYGRTSSILRCLQSLEASFQQTSSFNFKAKVYVGCNGDHEAYLQLKKEFGLKEFVEIEYWQDHLPPSAARNKVLQPTLPGWILFLDDDVAVPEKYFENFFRIASPQFQVVGGPNINFPNSSLSERLQQFVLGSLLVSGPFAFRYSMRPAHKASFISSFVLCNLWIYNDSNNPIRFNPNYLSGEENELLDRLENKNFYYHPDVFVYHQRRENLDGFKRQSFKFGFGRGQFLHKRFLGDRFGAKFFFFQLLLSLLRPLDFLYILCISIGLYIRLHFNEAFLHKSQYSLKEIFTYAYTLHVQYFLGVVAGVLAHKNRT